MSKKNTISSKNTKARDDRPKTTTLPAGRQSYSSAQDLFGAKRYNSVTPSYLREVIPLIRYLMMHNPDVGQAIHNIVTLGNTGHKVFFDRKVNAEEVDKMRNHLTNKRKVWASGQAGMDGLVNRWFSQIMVSGALSSEWVIDQDFKGIEANIMVNPEDIEFKLSDNGVRYEPYQRVRSLISTEHHAGEEQGLIKLNTETYKYFALNGDGEVPYGFPPYLSVLPAIKTQNKMSKNIDFVVDQMGLLGFLQVLMAKPDPLPSESDSKYRARLDTLLEAAKTRVMGGFKDGIVAGFKDDHEFDFQGASKTFSDAVELFKNNELMIGSALKQDTSLWGRGDSTSETQITVVFIKLLSELRNIQNLAKDNLEFGYALELRLAGFNFDFLQVKFNKSTIQDDLKSQQAQEILIRNVKDKLILGVINQDQMADELGYEQSAFPEPKVEFDVLAGAGSSAAAGLETDKTKKKADVKKDKTKSAKKQRATEKPLSKS